jgi:hypothetical protein
MHDPNALIPTFINLPMTGDPTMTANHSAAHLPALDLTFYVREGDQLAHVVAALPASDPTAGPGEGDTVTADGTGLAPAGGSVGSHPKSGTVVDPVTGKPVVGTPAAKDAATSVQVQLGAGAIVIGIIVAAVFMIKHGKWKYPPLLTGIAIGTVSAGAGTTSIMYIPASLATALITAFGNALGGIA